MSSLGDSAEDSVIKSISDSIKFMRLDTSWNTDVLIPALLTEKSSLALSNRLDIVKLNSLTDGRSVGTSVGYGLTVPVSNASSDLGYTRTWNCYLMLHVDFLVACTELEMA